MVVISSVISETHYHVHLVLEFEIFTLGCMSNSNCRKSATFTSHFNKAESVYNIHGLSYIFVSLFPFSYVCFCIFTFSRISPSVTGIILICDKSFDMYSLGVKLVKFHYQFVFVDHLPYSKKDY
jgi:hypothetical protein